MRRLLVALLALGLLAGAVVWLARDSRDARRVTSSAELEHPGKAGTEDVVQAPLTAPPQTGAAREPLEAVHDAELARAWWVEGRVLFPPGTPVDEQAFVVANGKNFADGKDERVRVQPDGSFRVAFSERTQTGVIELRARYLFLEKSVRCESAATAKLLVLEPHIGGRIAGQLVPPVGTDPARVGGEVRLSAPSQDVLERVANIGADLAFAFDALDERAGLELRYEGKAFVATVAKPTVEVGRTKQVDVELLPAIQLAGHVRDARGAPLAGVEVSARRRKSEGTFPMTHANESEQDGSFRIDGLSSGEIQLVLRGDGFLPLERELGTLETGTVRSDLELVLERGESIAGTVHWPDGAPAQAKFELEAEGPKTNAPGARKARGTSDATGHFELSGLAALPYRLRAEASRTEEVPGSEPRKVRKTEWTAVVEHVQASRCDLVLTLSCTLEVSGRVVDDLGAPLSGFTLRGKSFSQQDPRAAGATLRQRFLDMDGRFQLTGFTPGEWELTAESDRHANSAPVSVSLPATEPVVLVLPREARITGVVVDAQGTPVGGATVRASCSGTWGETRAADSTDAQGVFDLRDLPPGRAQLTASVEENAPSETDSLDLVAGEVRTGVVLRLHTGGTILGEVREAGGRPAAGVRVRQILTDAQGRFELHGLAPGTQSLSCRTAAGLELSRTVTVTDGETVHVLLAPVDEQIVRVHGTVRAGGRPWSGAELSVGTAWTESGPHGEGARTHADDAGAYELTLTSAGRYELDVYGAGNSLNWRTSLDVPARADFAFDVDVPVGQISGRVTDARGNPVVSIPVHAEPETSADGSSAHALSDAEGRYELIVPEGHVVVWAGGSRQWQNISARGFVETRVSGLVVGRNGHLSGVDLVLRTGGTLAGRARFREGGPARGVQLFCSTAHGEQMTGFSLTDGRFEIEGLEPGTLWIGARDGTHATHTPVQVEIVAGETTRVELELEPATPVSLVARDAKGERVSCDIEVRDSTGRVIARVERGSAQLGPFVAGSYRIRASCGEKTIERELAISGQPDRYELDLVFE